MLSSIREHIPFSNTSSCIETVLWIRFHWSLFLRVHAVNNESALAQIIARRSTDEKSLSEAMIASWPTQIWVELIIQYSLGIVRMSFVICNTRPRLAIIKRMTYQLLPLLYHCVDIALSSFIECINASYPMASSYIWRNMLSWFHTFSKPSFNVTFRLFQALRWYHLPDGFCQRKMHFHCSYQNKRKSCNFRSALLWRHMKVVSNYRHLRLITQKTSTGAVVAVGLEESSSRFPWPEMILHSFRVDSVTSFKMVDEITRKLVALRVLSEYQVVWQTLYIWNKSLRCVIIAGLVSHKTHRRQHRCIKHMVLLGLFHYSDVIMSAMTSQITGFSIVCSTVCSGADQRKDQSSTSLAFMKGIYCGFPSQRASNAGNVSIWWYMCFGYVTACK